MNEITDLPPRGSRLPADGTGRCPGRNRPQVGAWLARKLLPDGGFVIDLMCGSGQLWLDKPENVEVLGTELKPERVALAQQNGVRASQGDAEKPWVCARGHPRLAIIFSPPFPNCNKMGGKNQKQLDKIEEELLHSMQDVGPMPNMMLVFQQIIESGFSGPIAVICKNYIRKEGFAQVEVNWTGELADMMTMLGLGPVEWFWYPVRPGRFEPGKRKRNPKHRIIDREIILIGGVNARS